MRSMISVAMIAIAFSSPARAEQNVATGLVKVAVPSGVVSDVATTNQVAQSAQSQIPAPSTGPASIQPPAAKVEPALPAKLRRKVLPGVGKYVLDDRNAIAPNVIVISNEGTRTVALSKIFPNRIATPFTTPRLIDSTKVDMKPDGSNIFINPINSDPFVVYITGSEPGDQVISLTIIPKDIPAQTVVLQVDAPATMRQQKTESYTQQIVDMLRRIAAGKTPEGFTEGRMPASVAVNGQLGILPKIRYSGSWVDIYRYAVINNGKEVVELSETSFYRKGVRAVSIFPNLTLRPNESTEVFVIADKTALDGGENGGR